MVTTKILSLVALRAISKKNVTVNESTVEQEFTVDNLCSSLLAKEYAANVKTLERCFNELIGRENGNIVDTVKGRIQNAILTAIDSVFTPKIELACRSINVSFGQDAACVMANSKRGEHVGTPVFFENVSESNKTLHLFNKNDEIRNKIPYEVSKLLVPGTRFDWQPLTHNSDRVAGNEKLISYYHCHFR